MYIVSLMHSQVFTLTDMHIHLYKEPHSYTHTHSYTYILYIYMDLRTPEHTQTTL